ncbi:hypothetical protein [uncultured Winogradskyella sp.]|uniref:hypothetical protein n=1 Tax=uncultured Winogradskyella sp. TaxID=395353 RepID=UPI0026346E10|nr:hypothetical protein [uncultured Winogradskyella sp.]
MKKKNLRILIIVFLTSLSVSAQETFKVMFYNLLNYPLEDAVPNREEDLEFILSEYQPDLFLVCELNNSTGANNVLNITKSAITPDFEMATYVSNTSDDASGDQNDLQNQLYYNSNKFILQEEIIVPTDLRDFNVYKLKINAINQSTNPVELYVVVCHLKASSGAENAQRRFNMVLELDTFLNTLPTNSNVLLGGDLNLYTGTEPAFQQLLQDTNNITFADPVNRVGNWNNNPNFVDVFTQSTRTQSGFGGTRGGFDDRFDFILTSENMLSTSNITYVPDSYVVYGNNGLSSCYNRRINSSDCGNENSEFSFAIRDALHNFSDHLPVTLSLQANITLSNAAEIVKLPNVFLENTLIDSELRLNFTAPLPATNNVYIYNQMGQKIETLSITNNVQLRYNTSHLSNGVYVLGFSESNIRPIKFVVAH